MEVSILMIDGQGRMPWKKLFFFKQAAANLIALIFEHI